MSAILLLPASIQKMPKKPIAFVLMRRTLNASVIDLLGAIGPITSDGATISGRGAKANGGIVTVDGVSVVITYAEFRAPLATFKTSLQSNWTWRNAAQSVSQHRAHVIVTALGTAPNHSAQLTAAIAISRVCAALAQQSDCCGIYWAAADLLIEPDTFKRELMLMRTEAGHLPLCLWVRFSWFRGRRPEMLGLASQGMGAFIGREIEFTPARLTQLDILNKAFGIAQWLLIKGLVFKDGDTCGLSQDDKIGISWRESGHVSQCPVIEFSVYQPHPISM